MKREKDIKHFRDLEVYQLAFKMHNSPKNDSEIRRTTMDYLIPTSNSINPKGKFQIE